MTEKKAMKYSIDVMRLVSLSDVDPIDEKTRRKATEMVAKWVRLNEKQYAAVDADTTTIITYGMDGVVGCSCPEFVDSENKLCKHLVSFGRLKTPTQLSISTDGYSWLRETLFQAGWYNDQGYVYPSPDAPEPEMVKLDSVNEEKELDIGVDEPEEPAPKTFTRKCNWCDHVESGNDREAVIARIAAHRRACKQNPANHVKPETKEDVKKPLAPEKSTTVKPPQKNPISLFDWTEKLVEFGVGQIFGDTGTAKTAFSRELAEQTADEGKKVVYWDTEGNMTRAQRAAMTEHKNITYILDRDWDHIKNMLSNDLSKGSPKLGKCDLFILDSIGVPVLGIYGTLKQNQKGNALQAMQGLLYQLTKFAEKNDAVVIVTNQPVSEMNKTPEERADRHPFGDKAMFFTKEILRISVGERTEYKTVCHIRAWRSRSVGRGKLLCTVSVSDEGVKVTPAGGE